MISSNRWRPLAQAWLLSVLLLGWVGADQSVHAESAAFAAAKRLGPGMNLGNGLEAPREGDWGIVLDKADFAVIAAAGFRHIRLPVRWSGNAEQAPPYTIDPDFVERVDWAIDHARRHGLAVVLDVHHYQEAMADPSSHRARLMALWDQIARHYASAPDDLYFEILNEPNRAMDDVWNEVLAENLAVIRQSNPTRPVVVGPRGNNSMDELDALELPDDPNLIVTVHNYKPLEFSHQGAVWVEGADAWLGRVWQGTPDEQAELIERFEAVDAWAREHRVPIYLGEFGAIAKADMASRWRWTNFVRNQAERRGWAWAYWEFRSGFGAFDLSEGRWNPLLSALMPGAPG